MDKLKSPQHALNRRQLRQVSLITGAGAAIARLIMIDHRITALHKT